MSNRGWLWLAGVAIAVVAIGGIVRRNDPPGVRVHLPAGVTAGTVMVACDSAVRNGLISPGTMRRVSRSDVTSDGIKAKYVLEIDSENAFGALVRSKWGCTYEAGRITDLTQLE